MAAWAVLLSVIIPRGLGEAVVAVEEVFCQGHMPATGQGHPPGPVCSHLSPVLPAGGTRSHPFGSCWVFMSLCSHLALVWEEDDVLAPSSP